MKNLTFQTIKCLLTILRVPERSLYTIVLLVGSFLVIVFSSWVYLYLSQCPTDKILSDVEKIVESMDSIHESLDSIVDAIGLLPKLHISELQAQDLLSNFQFVHKRFYLISTLT